MTTADLLLNVHGRLTAYSQAKALYAERLAPDFSVFEFLDTRENGLSRILAWLLDPLGNHAQGDRFLRAFVRWLSVDPAWAEGLSFARVATEVPTTTGASPDLSIRRSVDVTGLRNA